MAALAAEAASANVRLNSIGFVPARQKRATVLTAAGANAFNVRRVSDSSSAFAGTLSGAATNADTGESYRIANFDSLSETGDFFLDVTGVGTSVNFRVAPDAFNNSMIVNMKGFYGQRCGTAVSFTHNSSTYAYAACHLNDANLLYWNGSNTIQNGTGGWHDAGDYNKYIVNSGITMGMLLQAWERHSAALATLSLAHLPLAERTNAIPDYLDEAKVNLLWMLKELFPDGRVSHKLTTINFGGFIMPNTETATRYHTPWGTEAQGSFTGALALAARVYAPYDAAFAATCQAAALTAYGRLTSSAYVAADQSCCSTGGYSDGNDSDVRVWAAAEIWETTGLASALTDVETRLNATANKCDMDWDWANQRNLGTYTYALSARPGKNAAINTDARNDIVTAANTLLGLRNAHGYGRALNNYYWGVNGAVARTSMNLDVANIISPNTSYLDTAHDQLGFLYGRNFYNRSQVTGEGVNPPMAPHHRPSGADANVNPWPGHLVGGCWPSATEWTDVEANYEENEIAINWTGAMTYLLAMFVQPWPVAGSPTFTPTLSPSRTPSPSSTRSPSPSPTRTPTPTASPTMTSSRTHSATASRTASPSASASPSNTPSATGTVTPTPSRTASPSPTSSPTRTATRSSTVSATASPTETLPPPGSTDTFSPTLSPTASPTLTSSATQSATPTLSATPTRSPTPSSSPSSTATRSATATATATPSVTPGNSSTFTRTYSPSQTPSATESASGTRTPTSSSTASLSPSETPQSTASPSSTASESPSPSPTPPPPQLIGIDVTEGPVSGGTRLLVSGSGFAPGLSLSLNGIALLNITFISSGQVQADTPASPAGFADLELVNPDGRSALLPSAFEFKAWTPTNTPIPAKTAPKIKKSLPYPQPQSGPRITLAFELEGNADSVEIKIFSKAMACIGAWKSGGNFGPGWNQAAFDTGELAGGLYYYLLKVDGSAGSHSNEMAGKLYLLQ